MGQQIKNRVGRVTGNRQFFLLSLMPKTELSNQLRAIHGEYLPVHSDSCQVISIRRDTHSGY